MKFQRWNMHESDEQAVQQLVDAGYPYLVSAVLVPRGVRTAKDAAAVLRRETRLTLDPMDMKDMDRAVSRIRAALEKGETIVVFGDYDVDGITATCLVTDALRRAGGKCIHYIPHRIDDGYGLNCPALEKLRSAGATLAVTVDCGITGVEETAFAASIGLDMVITDHHECKEELPRAVAVVNPHRSDCPYPFKNLAGVGVALKLAMALAGKEKYDEVFQRYCTLAAIGTVADVMSMTGENRTIVRCGLARLPEADCVGLHALMREAGMDGKTVSSTGIGFVLAPRINAAGRMGQADTAAELFLTKDPARAEELARALCALNRERQQVEQEIFQEAETRIAALPVEERAALVLESDTWHQGVVGIVASRLSEKYVCPSFMIHMNGDVGKGSCRSWGGFNLFAALEECQDLLLGFGGHELAAGFTIARENIPAFRQRMNDCARAYYGEKKPVSVLEIDAVINRCSLLTLEDVERLSDLEPYGADNPRPVLCIRGLTVESLQNVGQNKHLKLRFSKGCGVHLDAIFFSATAERCGVAPGDRVDAAFYLNINEFRSRCTVQLQLLDLRPSWEPSLREREDLKKIERFLAGDGVTPQEAGAMRPVRAQCAGCWRWLDRRLPPEGETLETAYLPLLRELERCAGGMHPFLCAAMALEVFRERGLLDMEEAGDERILRRRSVKEKVDLEASVYLRTLREIEQNRR